MKNVVVKIIGTPKDYFKIQTKFNLQYISTYSSKSQS